jgi:hypothetical protein
MTALIMGSIVRDPVPADENTVRNTATPVYKADPPATMPDVPDLNEFETDPNPHLGMVERNLSSHIVPTQKYAPPWRALTDMNHEYTDRIDSTIGTVGLAPSREAGGEFGHGTMQVQIAIDPVQDLSGAGGFTNDYFLRHYRPIQETMPVSVQPPPNYDATTAGMVGAAGKQASRDATAASQYDTFYRTVTG